MIYLKIHTFLQFESKLDNFTFTLKYANVKTLSF